jgi:hypothetical protein
MIDSGPNPTYSNIGALTQSYYTQTLQTLIESLELALTEGLALSEELEVELDLDALLRMDTTSRYDAWTKAIGAGWMSPNEARLRENMEPVEGGDTPYLQQQNWSLAQLNKRDINAQQPGQAPQGGDAFGVPGDPDPGFGEPEEEPAETAAPQVSEVDDEGAEDDLEDNSDWGTAKKPRKKALPSASTKAEDVGGDVAPDSDAASLESARALAAALITKFSSTEVL